MRRLAHPAVYTISTKWVIILSNETIIYNFAARMTQDFTLKFFFKRGQGHLSYILLLLLTGVVMWYIEKVIGSQRIDNIS